LNLENEICLIDYHYLIDSLDKFQKNLKLKSGKNFALLAYLAVLGNISWNINGTIFKIVQNVVHLLVFLIP
jgi:hypothetical protein